MQHICRCRAFNKHCWGWCRASCPIPAVTVAWSIPFARVLTFPLDSAVCHKAGMGDGPFIFHCQHILCCSQNTFLHQLPKVHQACWTPGRWLRLRGCLFTRAHTLQQTCTVQQQYNEGGQVQVPLRCHGVCNEAHSSCLASSPHNSMRHLCCSRYVQSA
jgi:hypothetical protein